jgi:hypothetical protein
LRITLPDGRVIVAHGRRPAEEGWEVYFEDRSGHVSGTSLGTSLADLFGYENYLEEGDEGPDWLDRFLRAIS